MSSRPKAGLMKAHANREAGGIFIDPVESYAQTTAQSSANKIYSKA